MGFTGELNNDLYYDGIKLEKDKSYIWSGISSGLYTSCKWRCEMKIVEIIDDKIYIKSEDDGKLTEWYINDLKKSNIKIEPKK